MNVLKLFALALASAAPAAACAGEANDGKASPFGMCHGSVYQDLSERKTLTFGQKKNLAEHGVRWVRADLRPAWQPWRMENGRRVWNFDHAIQQANQAKNLGLNMLCLLNTTPDWMNPIPDHLDEWTNFVHQAVVAMKGRTDYFEVWNEENFTSTNLWGTADKTGHPRNYTKCLNAAYRAIKAANPRATVVYGGTTHVPLEFIRTCNEAGALYDAMNVHPYMPDTLPECGLRDILLRLKKVMRETGRGDVPIWVTEIGWSTSPQRPSSFLKDVFNPAFKALGMDPSKLTLTMVKGVSSEVRDFRERLPKFAAYHMVDPWDIDKLDVRKYPVLLPVASEWGIASTRQPVIDYVRRGGVVVFPESFVYNATSKLCDDFGNLLPGSLDKIDVRKELGLRVDATWTAPVTVTSNVTFSLDKPYQTKCYGHRFTHYLTAQWLPKDVAFTPVCWGVDAEKGKTYPVGGAYRFASGGGMVVAASPGSAARADVSPKVQALLVPRTYLVLLAEGMEKVFWYCAYSDTRGLEDSNLEANYGLASIYRTDHPENKTGWPVIKNKPGMKAYQTLARLLPSGAKVVLRQQKGVYYARWENKATGEHLAAVWAPYGKGTVRFAAKPVAAHSIFGKPLKLRDTYPVGPAVLYLAFAQVPELAEVDLKE
ncbi:MAG TPA: hypothetical protein DER26_00470 [Verrucomicrobia bacterium]|nr:hypothetical protein [Verrucomicrobiota bacterium]